MLVLFFSFEEILHRHRHANVDLIGGRHHAAHHTHFARDLHDVLAERLQGQTLVYRLVRLRAALANSVRR